MYDKISTYESLGTNIKYYVSADVIMSLLLWFFAKIQSFYFFNDVDSNFKPRLNFFLVIRCLLLFACCSLLFARCSLLVIFALYPLLFARVSFCSLLVIFRPLFVAFLSLFFAILSVLTHDFITFFLFENNS